MCCCRPCRPYSALFVFGDILSDTGNLSIATGESQPPPRQPYLNGRFSDGLLWIDRLAAGLALIPDVAVAGWRQQLRVRRRAPVRSDRRPACWRRWPGCGRRLIRWPTRGRCTWWWAAATTCDARSAFSGSSAADAAGRQAAADAAVFNLYQSLAVLAANGARHG